MRFGFVDAYRMEVTPFFWNGVLGVSWSSKAPVGSYDVWGQRPLPFGFIDAYWMDVVAHFWNVIWILVGS